MTTDCCRSIGDYEQFKEIQDENDVRSDDVIDDVRVG